MGQWLVANCQLSVASKPSVAVFGWSPGILIEWTIRVPNPRITSHCFPASHNIVSSRVTFRPHTLINYTEPRTVESAVRALEREPDERLQIAAAQSNPPDFAQLYENNFDRVYAFLARRVSTRDEAQDLTAEVFHQALASIRNFKWQGEPFSAWLYGIAANVLARHRQKLTATRPVEENDLSSDGDEIERSILLQNLVALLPQDQRHVLTRRFLDQKSIRDIAQEMGRSEGAIKQLQLRGLENLRDRCGRTR